MTELALYRKLLADIKTRIQGAQARAVLSANAEMIKLYWDVGHMLDLRQQEEGWGSGVIPRLARDLHNEFPEVKGFSERNLKLMLRFYREYSDPARFVQQPAAQIGGRKKVQQAAALSTASAVSDELPALLLGLPWGHHQMLMDRIKDLGIRHWYMQAAQSHGWSRAMLKDQIDSGAHARQGGAVSNFKERLPSAHSELVQQALKDPYLFDFLTLEEPFHERELETGLVRHLEKFLLELGQGFAFVGRQYKLNVGDDEFYIDLLFYHLKLRSYVVIELKRGEFRPEYAGKLNLYCNLVDDNLRHETDAPTIGLILCQSKNKVLAEYSLRGIAKPIGVADYQLTRALPQHLKSTLPTIEEIEAELQAGRDENHNE